MSILPLLLTLVVSPAEASTRTAVAFRACTDEASMPTPTGGSWANLVENMARITASAVRDTSGLELTLPREWSVRNNRMLWKADCAWSDSRLAEALEEDGVEQVLVISSAAGATQRELVLGRIVGGLRVAEQRIAAPAAPTVEAFTPVETQFKQAIDQWAEPPVDVSIRLVDKGGRPVECATWEIPGIATGSNESSSVRVGAGAVDVIVRGCDAWMSTRTSATIAPGAGRIEIPLVKKAHLVLDIPRKATVLVDGQTVSGPGSVWVTPDRSLTVILRQGRRQHQETVKLTSGEERTLKLRLPLFD